MSKPTWRKSTHSDDHGNCVELAELPHAIAIRDSKATDNGHLILTPQAFAALIHNVKERMG